ncbi:hypothetical protein V6C03_07570 [Methyloligella sp. 2.7D]|uniref:hypothetical protein n=1 Tax=unclassified Methyloligella TaxID=2625955 RepID=UPI00157C38AC|nr:hypothetical protein [Methyloligella sp. GL2]QKP78263.1 hypothetical protein HT051_12875 [Methyloligella sp. GL2]
MVQTALRLFTALFTLLSLTALPVSGGARAQAPEIWSASVTGDMSALRYGPLDDAALPIFLLSCFNDMKIAVLDVYGDLGEAKAGDALEMEVSGGKLAAPLKGKAETEETSGSLYAEASEFGIKPVINVLELEGPVTVKVGETKLELSDAGRAEAVKDFAMHCRIK